MNRPKCDKCHSIVPQLSYCIANFPHKSSPGGRIEHLFWYCDNCKTRIGSPIPKYVADGLDLSCLPKIIVRPNDCQENVDKQVVEVADTDPVVYDVYINSARWKVKSKACIKRFGGRCALCNGTVNLQAHHRTYERLGKELPEDLTALCNHCHMKFHSITPGKGVSKQ